MGHYQSPKDLVVVVVVFAYSMTYSLSISLVIESLIADISSSSSQSKGRKYNNHKHFYNIHIHIISTLIAEAVFECVHLRRTRCIRSLADFSISKVGELPVYLSI